MKRHVLFGLPLFILVVTLGRSPAVVAQEPKKLAVLEKEFLSHLKMSLAFSPDGKKLAIGGTRTALSGPQGVNIWDVAQAKLEQTLMAPPLKSNGATDIRGLVYSADGKVLAAGHTCPLLWDLPSGKPGVHL